MTEQAIYCPMRFGERVRAIREARGVSQNALARAAGIQQPTLNRVENDAQKDPALSVAVRIARGLEVSLDELCQDVAFDASADPADSLTGRVGALEGDMREVLERGEDVDQAILAILDVLAKSEIVRKPDASRLQQLLRQLQSRRHA